MTNNKTQSICPTCNAAIDPLLQRCACAPIDTKEPRAPSSTLVAQAESVFESYLAARVLRARRDLTAAKIALLRDPKNREKLEAIQRAQIEIEQLQAQLVEQTRKANQARTRAQSTPAALSAPPTYLDCPQCARRSPAEAKACSCGHQFVQDATHMTAKFLSIDEFIASLPRRPRK